MTTAWPTSGALSSATLCQCHTEKGSPFWTTIGHVWKEGQNSENGGCRYPRRQMKQGPHKETSLFAFQRKPFCTSCCPEVSRHGLLDSLPEIPNLCFPSFSPIQTLFKTCVSSSCPRLLLPGPCFPRDDGGTSATLLGRCHRSALLGQCPGSLCLLRGSRADGWRSCQALKSC